MVLFINYYLIINIFYFKDYLVMLYTDYYSIMIFSLKKFFSYSLVFSDFQNDHYDSLKKNSKCSLFNFFIVSNSIFKVVPNFCLCDCQFHFNELNFLTNKPLMLGDDSLAF